MQDPLPIQPLTGPFNATMRPPGSKSLTNRALLLAALADGVSTLTGVLFSDDTQVMMGALAALGFTLEIDEANRTVTVHGQGGRIPAKEAQLFLGNAGTATRFLTAACCLGQPGSSFTLTGVPRMHERPIGQLVDPLRQLGADITYMQKEGYPPLLIRGGGLKGGSLTLPTTLSSQYISALLQIGPYLSRGLQLSFEGEVTSLPYIQMTLELMREFGVNAALKPTLAGISPIASGDGYQGISYAVEPDASNASYFLAAAAVMASASCTIPGLGTNSMQGDRAFARVLADMGANVEQSEHLTTVRAAELRGYGASLPDLNDIPDTAQTLAVVALFAEGETVIRNVGNLRVKETDRMAAIKNECEKLGAKVAIEGDDIRITPPDGNVLRHPDGEPISDERPVEIDTYDDHRMAMSFAIAGLRQAGIRIKDPACVNKTYPNFFDDLATLAGGGNVREPATPSKGS